MKYEDYFRMLSQLFGMAVWDRDGKMWCPMFGYAGEIVAYAPALEAITIFNEVAETVE